MRVVMVAHAFPRWTGDPAGAFLLRLAEALAARDHTLVVITPSDRGRAGRFSLGPIEVLQVRFAAAEREDLAYSGEMVRKARTPAGAWSFLRLVYALRAAARSEARRIDAQVLHAFWWVPAGWAVVGSSLPTVVSLMGTDVTTMRSLPASLLARRVLRRASRVTALSTFLADEARAFTGLSSLEIDRVPVPVDTARFQRAGTGERRGVVYLGRLARQKRVDLLLEAVYTAGLQVPVSIIGDGPMRGDLERQAARLGLGGVQFLGALPDEKIPDVIAGAAVCACISEREGLGLAAAEALMLGTPVVATTDGGGVLDLVHDGEGACVVPPTAAAIGAALSRCLFDTTVRAAAARAGDGLRDQLSPDAVARQFEQVYDRVSRPR